MFLLKDAKESEKLYIALLRTMDDRFGYNIKQGGECEILPDTVKEKISKSHIGISSYNKGKHLSPETKKKISEAQKGRHMSDEHYKHFIEAMNKRKSIPGRKLSESEIENIRQIHMKKVLCVETGIIYESMTKCAKDIGVLVSNLSKAIKKNRKYKGYHFEIVYS